MAKDILVVQVGTDSRPADEADIKNVTKTMKKALKDVGDKETTLFVTHHAINMYKLSSLDYNKPEETNRFSQIVQLFDRGIITSEKAKEMLGL